MKSLRRPSGKPGQDGETAGRKSASCSTRAAFSFRLRSFAKTRAERCTRAAGESWPCGKPDAPSTASPVAASGENHREKRSSHPSALYRESRLQIMSEKYFNREEAEELLPIIRRSLEKAR